MDVASAVASLVTTAITLVNFAKDVKGAPQEWLDTQDQIDCLKNLLQEYERKTQEAGNRNLKTTREHIEPLIKQTERVFEELRGKCPTEARGIKKLWKRAKWPIFPKKDAEDLQKKLHTLRSSFQLAIAEDTRSFVVNELQGQWLEESSGPPIASIFFYISADSAKSLTTEKIIRTLVLQLLSRLESRNTQLGKAPFPKLILDLEARFAKNNLLPPLQELIKAFLSLVECPEFAAGVLLTIDNLQLLPLEENPRLAESLRHFLTSAQKSDNVKLLLCDRNASADSVLDESKDVKFYELFAQQADLKTYLKSKMESERFNQSLRREKKLTKNEIIESVIGRSGKCFLLAELLMRELLDLYSARSISAILMTLPKEFLEIYRNDLIKVANLPDEKSLFAKKAISWVFYAKPRPLSAYELQCAVNFGSPDFDDPESITVDINLIIQWCQGLIETEAPKAKDQKFGPEPSSRVRFVHDTVIELLRKEPELVSAIEADIATECINYLENVDETEINSDDISSRGRSEFKARKYGLLSYSTEMWGVHASRCSNAKVDDLSLEFLQQDRNLQLALEAIPEDAYYKEVDIAGSTILHLAAHFDYAHLAKLAMEKGLIEVDTVVTGFVFGESETPKTALIWAIISDSERVTRCLIDHGANVNVNIDGWTALHWAVVRSRTSLVKLLLENGAEVNLGDEHKQTPLILAAARGLPDIASMLLSYGACLETCDNLYKTPIHHAAEQGHLLLLKWAIQQAGHDSIYARAAGNRTVLSCAVSSGSAEVVSYILTLSPSKEDITDALDWAVRSGHLGVVWALLRAGADCNHQFREWSTVQDVSEKSSYWTPLQRASYQANLQVMSLLLTYGADMYETAHGDYTSKDWAVKSWTSKKGENKALSLLENWEKTQGLRPNTAD
ncbi:Ankyrin-3 [Orbilia brochopaga]|nr:Ankyrin-3 [Drechslerella brochopaga]